MIIINEQIKNVTINYPLESISTPESIFFLDIETTGFSASSSFVYLIGGCFLKNKKLEYIQWFAKSADEEKEILIAFKEFIKNYTMLIHFNGNQFDLPFLIKRANVHDIDLSFDTYNGLDIYKRIKPYKYFLKLSNCRQKTIEHFLGINREDKYSGGELISIYSDYCNTNDSLFLNLLLLHNKEDLIGMIEILPILAYSDIFNHTLYVKKVNSNYYRDINHDKKQELVITVQLSKSLSVPISYHANECYFTATNDIGILRVPIYEEELKYYYENYKDYYYLPDEDVAIHKSVSSFVEKTYRENATAKTCYTRKFSTYLPQWDYIFSPFFKREFKSQNLFFEFTDEFKKNRTAFSNYASHILMMLASFK
ncbi:MAG: ribonuclease H-like domain-containing protein [Lachnospiraceae bacterium]